MSTVTLFGLCAAALVGLGLYGALTHPQPLRKLIAFNLLGSGVFLLFGVFARRGAWQAVGGDPVPQALVITGIVVAVALTAFGAAMIVRQAQTRAAAKPAADDNENPAP